MKIVGAYKVKKHLPKLLERVSRGEKILITRHGHAVAMLVPAQNEGMADVPATIRKMRELRKGVTLGPDLTIRQLIEEGRRF